VTKSSFFNTPFPILLQCESWSLGRANLRRRPCRCRMRAIRRIETIRGGDAGFDRPDHVAGAAPDRASPQAVLRGDCRSVASALLLLCRPVRGRHDGSLVVRRRWRTSLAPQSGVR
jgi:hypothetical protein